MYGKGRGAFKQLPGKELYDASRVRLWKHGKRRMFKE